MKKSIIALSLLGINLAFGANPALEKMLLERTGEKIKVVKEIPMEDLRNMKLVVLETAQQQMVFLANGNNNTIVAIDSTFLTSNNQTLATISKEIKLAQMASAKSTGDKIIKGAKENNYPVISLKSPTKTNKTLYVVTDPNCPYCRDELDHVEDRLKTHNIKMIIVGILHESSLSKAEDAYQAVAKLKTNDQKIAALRKIYYPSYQTNTTPTQKTLGITNLIRESGVNSVPYRFEIVE